MPRRRLMGDFLDMEQQHAIVDYLCGSGVGSQDPKSSSTPMAVVSTGGISSRTALLHHLPASLLPWPSLLAARGHSCAPLMPPEWSHRRGGAIRTAAAASWTEPPLPRTNGWSSTSRTRPELMRAAGYREDGGWLDPSSGWGRWQPRVEWDRAGGVRC